MTTVSLHDLGFGELQARLEQDGVKPVHALALFRQLQRHAPSDPWTSDHFSPPLRRWLEGNLGGAVSLDELALATHTPSQDGRTQKYLLRLGDGQEIETVTMGYPGRFTACLSTQAGCAMGCVFCATGQMGFARHLRPGEIVAQARYAERALGVRGERLRNVVLMGMGEPLHNYDNVLRALDMLSDPRGMNVTPARITINTVGVAPAIVRLATEGCPYNLGVSLHAAADDERSALVPVNRRWPLHELMAACRTYCRATNKRIFFSWTLIDGVNDGPDHAAHLVRLLLGLDAHVNLIRLNETRGYAGHQTSSGRAEDFRARLRRAGLPCTIRQRRGLDVAAGCGQLTAEKQLIKSRRQGPSPAP